MAITEGRKHHIHMQSGRLVIRRDVTGLTRAGGGLDDGWLKVFPADSRRFCTLAAEMEASHLGRAEDPIPDVRAFEMRLHRSQLG